MLVWENIFSGRQSQRLWNEINAIQDESARSAVYGLGCELQELETRITDELDHLYTRLEALEEKEK